MPSLLPPHGPPPVLIQRGETGTPRGSTPAAVHELSRHHQKGPTSPVVRKKLAAAAMERNRKSYLVRRWLLRRWLLRRWLLWQWLVRRWLVRRYGRWLLWSWPLQCWLVHLCGMKTKTQQGRRRLPADSEPRGHSRCQASRSSRCSQQVAGAMRLGG